jgi:hypothetical protein
LEDETAQLRAEVAKLKVALDQVGPKGSTSIDQENICPEGEHPPVVIFALLTKAQFERTANLKCSADAHELVAFENRELIVC